MSDGQRSLLRGGSESSLRQCSHCLRMLPANAFHRRRNRARTCKTCLKAAAALVGAPCLDAHLDAVRARLKALLQSGGITVTPCTVCGDQNVQAHHVTTGESPVQWLCPLHHASAHGRADFAKQMDLF